MKTRTIVTLLVLFSSIGSAFAQSRGGRGTIDGTYQDDVQNYIKQLPDCSSPPPDPNSKKTAMDPLSWVNKIALVFSESLEDAAGEFSQNTPTAYLKLKAALEAVTIATENCQDLRSILSRPIADETLKAIRGLEQNIDPSDEVSMATELYTFSRSSVVIAKDAALTVDQDYFAPYVAQWRPSCGFVCNGDMQTLPFPQPEPFPQKLLDIAARSLRLLDSLGTADMSRHNVFHPYFGLVRAYLPTAQLIITTVYDSLKTNMAILSKEEAFVNLEVLKNQVDHYVDENDFSRLPVEIEKTHVDADLIARELEECPYRRHFRF